MALQETGIALFSVFGSTDKMMHINPGGHMDIPLHERAAWTAFYERHLA